MCVCVMPTLNYHFSEAFPSIFCHALPPEGLADPLPVCSLACRPATCPAEIHMATTRTLGSTLW